MLKKFTFKKGDIEYKLRNWFSNAQRIVIAGMGNPLRKDDSVGIRIVRNLRHRVPQAVFLIECETVPERYMEEICEFKPSHILIIDAVYSGLKPGSSDLIDPNRVEMAFRAYDPYFTSVTHLATSQMPAIRTHAMPLHIFCEALVKTTKAKLSLLAIQPQNTSIGEGISPEVEKSAEHLTDLLSRIMDQALAGNRC